VKNQQNPAEFLNLLDQFDIYMGEICGNRIYAKLMQTVVHLRRETSLKLLKVPGAIDNSVGIRNSLMHSIQSKDMKMVKNSVHTFFKNSKQFYDNIISKA
jgi:DNA-binding GntR family transcriptional regulator